MVDRMSDAGNESNGLRRVGDLAAATGLTVRALHHYEEIGLLAPATRSPAGHRLYGADAVERLYRVQLLRRLGLSLDAIAKALDDQSWSLRAALAQHNEQLTRTLTNAARLQSRLVAALATVDDNDPNLSNNLVAILEDMTMQDTLIRNRISILVYADLAKAHAYLTDVFGLTPGELTTTPDGTVVHAELYAGDGVVWLHPETETYGLASPQSLGAATATMAVMVDDVDEHFRQATAKGATIVYEPVDQPYGYREYSARDCEGALWSFMKPLG